MAPNIGESYAKSIGQTYVSLPHSANVPKNHGPEFWKRLTKALNDAGYDKNHQMTVTRLIKISQPSVHEWEKGITMPSMANVRKLATKLSVDANWLFTGNAPRAGAAPSDPLTLEMLEIWGQLSRDNKLRVIGAAKTELRDQFPEAEESSELHRGRG